MRSFTRLAARIAAVAMLSFPAVALAAKNWIVNTCDDPGEAAVVCRFADYDGSFRTAFDCARDGDTVDLTQLQCDTITLSSGLLNISAANFSVVGPGKDRLVVDLNGKGHIAHSGPDAQQLNISDLTISNGYVASATGTDGGCLYSYANVALTDVGVADCKVESTATDARGGGIYAKGKIVLTRSRISGNLAASSAANASGGGAFAGGPMTINASTLADNRAQIGDPTKIAAGGGAMMMSAGDVSLSTFSGNVAEQGSAIYSRGEEKLNIDNSTIARNTLRQRAPTGPTSITGVLDVSGLNMRHCTVAANQVADLGAGIASSVDNGFMILQNVILTDGVRAPSLTVYGDHNLITLNFFGTPIPADTLASDPMLGELRSNGGPTQTMMPAPGSPAIGAGSNPFFFPVDQRGAPRAGPGNAIDIGAVATDTLFHDGFDNFWYLPRH